jgi:ubiquinone biosynthesis monooxygenase Coq7
MTEESPARGTTAADRLPGDLDKAALIDRMLRVDHAGEYGAKRIYAGQLAVLGDSASAPTLRRMAEQEDRHLEAFEKLMVERRVRPTLLQPVWYVAGFALGAATAWLGERAAMACTVAVEEVIDEHYRGQAAELGDDEAALRRTILEFRADEIEHRDAAIEAGAADAPAYELLTAAIKTASRTAIWLSERV